MLFSEFTKQSTEHNTEDQPEFCDACNVSDSADGSTSSANAGPDTTDGIPDAPGHDADRPHDAPGHDAIAADDDADTSSHDAIAPNDDADTTDDDAVTHDDAGSTRAALSRAEPGAAKPGSESGVLCNSTAWTE